MTIELSPAIIAIAIVVLASVHAFGSAGVMSGRRNAA